MEIDFNLIARKLNQYNKYLLADKKREYKQSYPYTEFECKVVFIPANLGEIIRFILTNIRNNKISIDEIAQRQEFHHFYSNRNIHRAFVFLRGSREVWIKEKSGGNATYSPQYNIPILIRREKKLKPADLIYSKLFLETLRWNYAGSFQKESIDISLWFKQFLYTITIAESNTSWSKFMQIEIEYDGHSLQAKHPSKKTVISLFDQIMPLLLPKSMMRFTTETKLQWLKSNRKHLSKQLFDTSLISTI